MLGLVAFVLLSLVPLRQVRLGSNLLVGAATIFLAVQLISVYRPPVDPVTVATPLAGEWWVGHGGHAELVNDHQARSTNATPWTSCRSSTGASTAPAAPT